MKTLYIISKGLGKKSDKEILELERQNRMPRVTKLEREINAELLEENFLAEKTPPIRRFFYRWLPVYICQIIEALIIHRRYDVILSHSQRVGFPLAYLMKILRIKTPHVLIISRITSVDPSQSARKIWFMKKIKNSVSKFLIWSIAQHNLAIERLGVDPSKILRVRLGTDQKFWKLQADPPETDTICAVGMEARDYPTLIEALRPLDIPCHIAAGSTRGELFDTVKKLYEVKDVPKHITVGKKTHEELRNLYARTRFAVVPLIESDSDNGQTTILEAMSMSKPVICSKTEGQVGIIKDGVNGIFVPQGDPIALRNAIQELWADPQKCEEMGRKGREFIENYHSLEQFVEAVSREVRNAASPALVQDDLQLTHIKT